MSEENTLTIIQETTVRLLNELQTMPESKKRIQEENKKRREDAQAEARAENPKMDEVAMMFAAIYKQLNKERFMSKIHIRITATLLDVFVASLSEQGQHEAFRRLRKLNAEEVFREYA